MPKKMEDSHPLLSQEIQTIREEIGLIELVASGTLCERTKVCGRSNCRCARDPAARHGPYYEWTRRENGRYVHSVISAKQATMLAAAIANHKRVLALLARWSTETAKIIGDAKIDK